MINLFGRNYEEIGSKDNGLILRSSGKIKLLWGNSFIDLINDKGKINTDIKIILKVSSTDNITSDGFYLVNDSLIAKIGQTILTLNSDGSNSYISFVSDLELKDTEKEQVLKNIGLISDGTNFPTNGIVYIPEEKRIYTVTDGDAEELIADIPSNVSKEVTFSKNLKLDKDLNFNTFTLKSENGISILNSNNTIKFIINNSEVLNLTSNGVLQVKELTSPSEGFKLYSYNGKYTLEVDKIITTEPIIAEPVLFPVRSFGNENIIKSVSLDNDKYYLILKYPNNYIEGDTLVIYYEADNQIHKIEGCIITEIGEDVIIVNSSIEIPSNISNAYVYSINNKNLVIGDFIGYNSVLLGIESKLNLLYSAKFELDNNLPFKYPFYSSDLYDEIDRIDDYNFYKNIIPPIGIIQKITSQSQIEILNRLDAIDSRLNVFENKLEELEHRVTLKFEEIDEQLSSLDNRVTALEEANN